MKPHRVSHPLCALAWRSPVPVKLDVDIAERFSERIEITFLVASVSYLAGSVAQPMTRRHS
jgi:hypothetical protein